MSQFTVGMAKDIYKKGYWDANKLNDIYKISPYIAMEMFEVGVNLGVMKPALWLQRLCNCLNTIKGGKYKYGNDLALDGIIGKTTIQRLSEINRKGHQIIYNGINAMQMSHYITISYIKPTMRQFFVGWSTNRIDFYPYDAEKPIHS
jgi:lysozyme family protein